MKWVDTISAFLLWGAFALSLWAWVASGDGFFALAVAFATFTAALFVVGGLRLLADPPEGVRRFGQIDEHPEQEARNAGEERNEPAAEYSVTNDPRHRR